MLDVLFKGASPFQTTVLEALDCSQGHEGQVTVAATGYPPAAQCGAECCLQNLGTTQAAAARQQGPE